MYGVTILAEIAQFIITQSELAEFFFILGRQIYKREIIFPICKKNQEI